MIERRDRRHPGGFTLVEILVAFAITAILSVAIYSLFTTTSQAMFEADSLAESTDSARFALERIKSDIQNAGSMGTPDSARDPWVEPKPSASIGSGIRVAGLVTYTGGSSAPGWQDYAQEVMSTEVYEANHEKNNSGALLSSSDALEAQFDGIIVIGAYDYPLSFEIGAFTNSGANTVGEIPKNERGVFKLLRNNPFNTDVGDAVFTSYSDPYGVLQDNMTHRILRVMDRAGFRQFAGITGATDQSNGAITASHLEVTLGQNLYFRDNSDSSNERFGLEPETAQNDVSYDAALLDVYWYHVIKPDHTEEGRYQLVRHRLDGQSLLSDITNSTWEFDPTSHIANVDGDGTTEDVQDDYVVIADNVADFQIWFECAGTDGTVTGIDWEAGWNPPDGSGSDDDHNCVDPTATPQIGVGEARIAHVRLSVRTENERRDAGILPDGSGFFHEPFPPSPTGDAANRQMQTFDATPGYRGATRVHTVQADVELQNFAMRNITP